MTSAFVITKSSAPSAAVTDAVHAEPVPERLAAAEHALVAVDEQIALDLRPEVGVAEPDAVADRRAEQLGCTALAGSAAH